MHALSWEAPYILQLNVTDWFLACPTRPIHSDFCFLSPSNSLLVDSISGIFILLPQDTHQPTGTLSHLSCMPPPMAESREQIEAVWETCVILGTKTDCSSLGRHDLCAGLPRGLPCWWGQPPVCPLPQLLQDMWRETQHAVPLLPTRLVPAGKGVPAPVQGRVSCSTHFPLINPMTTPYLTISKSIPRRRKLISEHLCSQTEVSLPGRDKDESPTHAEQSLKDFCQFRVTEKGNGRGQQLDERTQRVRLLNQAHGPNFTKNYKVTSHHKKWSIPPLEKSKTMNIGSFSSAFGFVRITFTRWGLSNVCGALLSRRDNVS